MSAMGKEVRSTSQLPLLSHYGKVGWSNSRRELSFGDYYLARPNIIFGKRPKSPPPRQLNSASRTREHLTPDEVERMIAAARQAGRRVAERDALLIMMAVTDSVPRR
jgi:hypothetical protein